MPPNGKTEEQNQILENLVSQGYDAIAVSVIAPKDQVPVLNRARPEDAAHHVRLRRGRLQAACCTWARSTTRRARRSGSGSSSSCRKGGKMAVFVGFFSADNAAQRLKGDRGRGRRARHRDRRAARGPDGPGQGALERRGHPERAAGPGARLRALVLQRPGDRRGAGGHRQEGQGPGRGVRRGGRHAQGHQERHHRGHGGPAPLRDGLPLGQVDAPPGHGLREGARPRSRRTASRTRASRSSTRTTSPTSRSAWPSGRSSATR